MLPWSPLENGFPSEKYTRAEGIPSDTRRAGIVGTPSETQYTVIDTLCAVAEEAGASPAAVALAWVQGRPGITSTLVGPRSGGHLEAHPAALELRLTDDQRSSPDDVSEPSLNFPADLNRRVAPMLK